MTTLEDRFLIYSNNKLSKQELDDSVFNFMGFVKTMMLIAQDNEEKRKLNESSNFNQSVEQRARRRKVS